MSSEPIPNDRHQNEGGPRRATVRDWDLMERGLGGSIFLCGWKICSEIKRRHKESETINI